MSTQKTEHKVGERLYLSQITGSFYIDAIKTPWTVIESKPSSITIQRAKEIYNGPRYYDTLPDDIQEDPNGETLSSYGRRQGRLGLRPTGAGTPDTHSLANGSPSHTSIEQCANCAQCTKTKGHATSQTSKGNGPWAKGVVHGAQKDACAKLDA